MAVNCKGILKYRESHPRNESSDHSFSLAAAGESLCLLQAPTLSLPRKVLHSCPSNAAAFAHPLCPGSSLAAVHMMTTPARTPDGATFFVEADCLCGRLSPAPLLLQIRRQQHNRGACQVSPGGSFQKQHATPHAFRAEDIS